MERTDGTATVRAAVTERVAEGSIFVSSLLQGGIVSQFLTSYETLPLVKAGIALGAPFFLGIPLFYVNNAASAGSDTVASNLCDY